MSRFDAVRNLALKGMRRIGSAPKPFVRLQRRRAREREQRGFRTDAERLDQLIAGVGAGTGSIIAGPWLGEVGYEVLYWIPFLRWFQDHYAVPRERLIVVSRGGMEAAYESVAGTYVDLFDLLTPAQLAAGNARRRLDHEGGGQKQSSASAFDDELLAAVRARVGISSTTVCHPSLMFELFRHVWHGNLPYDLLWRRTRFHAARRRSTPSGASGGGGTDGLPSEFVAVKVYAGPALTFSDATRRTVRHLVAAAASRLPVVLLETDIGVDEHSDLDLGGIAGVTTMRDRMQPRTNLGLQIDVISRATYFLGTCGGLAWLAPFLGVPTVALYDSDQLLGPHLYVAREAGVRSKAAEFTPLDLRALQRLAPGADVTRVV
jgi:hypothetical protein